MWSSVSFNILNIIQAESALKRSIKARTPPQIPVPKIPSFACWERFNATIAVLVPVYVYILIVL